MEQLVLFDAAEYEVRTFCSCLCCVYDNGECEESA